MYLKQRLTAGESALGALFYSNSPEAMEYAGIGMRDLALRLGRDVNDFNAHLSLQDELAHVNAVCRRHGKAATVAVASAEELVLRVRDGYRLICASSDILILAGWWSNMRHVFKKTLKGQE